MQSSFSFAWKRNYSARINSHCLEWYEAHIHTSIVYKQIALWFVEFMPSTELPIFRCPCAPRNMKLRCAIKIRQWTCNNNKIYVHIKAFRTNEKQVYRKKMYLKIFGIFWFGKSYWKFCQIVCFLCIFYASLALIQSLILWLAFHCTCATGIRIKALLVLNAQNVELEINWLKHNTHTHTQYIAG